MGRFRSPRVIATAPCFVALCSVMACAGNPQPEIVRLPKGDSGADILLLDATDAERRDLAQTVSGGALLPGRLEGSHFIPMPSCSPPAPRYEYLGLKRVTVRQALSQQDTEYWLRPQARSRVRDLSQFDLTMSATGVYNVGAAVRRKSLSAECQQASYFVLGLIVGALQLVGTADGSIADQARSARLFEVGDLNACRDSNDTAAPRECDHPIRMILLPLP
jgi:hypothetical protein